MLYKHRECFKPCMFVALADMSSRSRVDHSRNDFARGPSKSTTLRASGVWLRSGLPSPRVCLGTPFTCTLRRLNDDAAVDMPTGTKPCYNAFGIIRSARHDPKLELTTYNMEVQ